MKNLFSALLLSFVCLFATAQDEYKRLELTDGQKDPVTVEFDYCKLFIYTSSSRNGSGINITMEIENNDNPHYIFLFGQPYDKKSLKKQKPSIIFDKYSGGIENIITCSGCRGDEIVRIEPDRKRTLNYENVGDSKLELPIYIVKNQIKKSGQTKRFIILRRYIITLDVTVKHEDTADEEYQKLSAEYEDLLDELNGKTFCPRSSHRQSLEKQEESYKAKIQEILDGISEIKKENNWRDRSEGYQRFKELKKKLEDIDFKEYEKWCGECRSTPRSVRPDRGSVHQCDYCNKSLTDIVRSLDRIYQKLDTGTSKSSVMGEVNALHAAWTRGCPTLSKKKRDDTSGTSEKIDNYYNRIVNF